MGLLDKSKNMDTTAMKTPEVAKAAVVAEKVAKPAKPVREKRSRKRRQKKQGQREFVAFPKITN